MKEQTRKKRPAVLAIFIVLAIASLVLGILFMNQAKKPLQEARDKSASMEEKMKNDGIPEDEYWDNEEYSALQDEIAGLNGKKSLGIALIPTAAALFLGGIWAFGAKRTFTVKTIVSIAIGAALFFVLGRFASIPSGVPNTNIAIQYGVLAFIAGVFGPIAGALAGFIGHFFIDLSMGWGVWWSWVITSGFFGLAMGVLGAVLKVNKVFDWKKILLFNMAQIIVNLLSWAVMAPILDIIIYQEDKTKVFTQGIVSAGINILATAVVGTVLFIAYGMSRPKQGSLKEEA